MKLTDEQKAKAIEMAVEGESLTRITKELCLSANAFWRARKSDPVFQKTFERARREGLEHIADGLLTITDEEPDVYRARLKSDNAKWLLSKRKPEVYGDRVEVNVNQTVDIRSALDTARQRAKLPERVVNPLLPGEVDNDE